ncbi:conserved hypothetical protein [Hymenobacter roseosalivarius DSM 11622]|uniref:Prokaryotic glutathione synthetase ATP-binding domain-containing protein n=1 Tax=Hymenobacter roseosalivarius DSM 11622 TaxID=645990 RepID=A0A1W1VLP8_9BACT|nr:hypothetical protein [Hymenobacter roseosalivarius]SMB94292.1 conserved hypothetical protein [Hymenobacter roseosalivarius DSM 11622]
MNIALVTYQPVGKYTGAGVEQEDALLTSHLQSRGHQVTAEIWSDPSVDWRSYEVVMLKSPWDYFDRIDEFYAWLDTLERLQVRVLNPVATVRWNSDKKYLLDMQAAGVRIVPTHWLPRGSRFRPEALFAELQTEQLIVKPAISGGAKNTFSLRPADAATHTLDLDTLLAEEDFLAQPFLPQIQTAGEWSLIYLGGKFSHCVLKTPKSGDFRVQHHLGGGIEPRPAPAHLRHAADDIVARFAQGCLYARVDGVEVEGDFMLMELELIEPFLYLTSDEKAPQRYEEGLRALV